MVRTSFGCSQSSFGPLVTRARSHDETSLEAEHQVMMKGPRSWPHTQSDWTSAPRLLESAEASFLRDPSAPDISPHTHTAAFHLPVQQPLRPQTIA